VGSIFSNLKSDDGEYIVNYTNNQLIKQEPFIDYYCPKCNQPTTIIFKGGNLGYWGELLFNILKMIVIKTKK
jgi:hypothetical protein